MFLSEDIFHYLTNTFSHSQDYKEFNKNYY